MPTNGTPSIIRGRPYGQHVVGTVVEMAGLTCREYGGRDQNRVTEFLFDDVEITITDALSYFGMKIYDFPAGLINVTEAAGCFTITTTSVLADTLNASKTVNWGIGSVTASNVTLATTMIDMLPGSGATLPALTSSATINVASASDFDYLKHATAQNAAAIFDGSATAIDMYFNLGIPTNTDIDANATVLVNGKLIVEWNLIHDGGLTNAIYP